MYQPSFRDLVLVLLGLGLFIAPEALQAASKPTTIHTAARTVQSVTLVGTTGTADVVVSADDYPVVKMAAAMFSDDVERVTGKRPAVRAGGAQSRQIVLVGTLGHSALIDRLAKSGRLADVSSLRGRWEATSCQIVDRPFPGVARAYVIVGSDRRGAAYGLMDLSQQIGVSPWYWWADVPVTHQDTLTLSAPAPEIQSPDVKYRGIFINDEDWGLKPWASKTFDPQFKNIGPKTYAKVFELMLRLKLNYLWPAMHPCSTEFASVPENIVLADKYGIVMGASHTEAMLCNNVWWPKDKGPWNYATNRDAIDAYWAESAKTRGSDEAVWTLGIRGIHDSPMEGPHDVSTKVALLHQAITDQRDLLTRYVSSQWGPVAQCFVPYKEVQPLYDAGLEVPPDVTLVWADDNYGYLRRLSSPAERQRPGGAGFYYHLSYYGRPHSYTWIDTTPPALMWEEMHKAWDNQARTLWMNNVGDIKPSEIDIDFYARLAWNAASVGPDAQPRFLQDFARRTFGPQHAAEIASFLTEYYRLGQIRKPECMDRSWADHLTPAQANTLATDYQQLLDREQVLSGSLPPASKDAWTEMAGYPARMLAATGLVFLADRSVRAGVDVDENTAAVEKWHMFIKNGTSDYNNQVAGGKWRDIMTAGGSLGAGWQGEPWPWLPEKPSKNKTNAAPTLASAPTETQTTIPAAAFSRKQDHAGARWVVIAGLGYSSKAVALESAAITNAWTPGAATAPSLEYDFEAQPGGEEATIDLLPTYRIYPGLKLRLAVSVDNAPAQVMEVPGSDGSEDENGPDRRDAVRNNRVSLRVPLPNLAAGRHTLKIQAVDPGAVIDELSFGTPGTNP